MGLQALQPRVGLAPLTSKPRTGHFLEALADGKYSLPVVLGRPKKSLREPHAGSTPQMPQGSEAPRGGRHVLFARSRCCSER